MDEIMILPMITERDGVPVTTSRALADHFGKQHKNVLRDIENTIAQLNDTENGKAFSRLNFEPRTALDSRGKEQPLYLLTRDAFTLLAMGFTGARALAFKVAYINAFNRMEKLLTGHAEAEAIPVPAIEPTRSAFSERFLDAIRAALDSGRYTLLCKRQRKRRESDARPGAEVIGVYDEYEVVIGVLSALKAYEATTGERLHLFDIRAALIRDGVIIDDAKGKRVRRIGGKEVSAIRIPRALLKRPL